MSEKRITIQLEAKVAAFEKALEERFKPALAKAISDVVDEFLSDEEEFISITEERGGDE